MNIQGITSQSSSIDQFGNAVARQLSEGLQDLPHDITERLRAARVRAVANRPLAVVKAREAALLSGISVSGSVASLHAGQGTNDLNDDASDNMVWWRHLGALLPLLALVAGLITIAVIQDDNRIREVAEVDAELLTDELPPSAYVDPGFMQFVRSNRSE